MAFQEASLALANLLNRHKIQWAYGGSSLLYYLGIPVTPRDLDVVVALADVEQAKAALLSDGAEFIEEKVGDDTFLTQVFYTFKWHDIEVDFMAVPGIGKDGEQFFIPFDKEGPWRNITIDNTVIGLCSPVDWLKYYSMMTGRQLRVAQLQDYLESADRVE